MDFFRDDLITNYNTLIGINDVYIYNYKTIQPTKHKSKISQALKTCCSNNIGLDYINNQNRSLASKNNVAFDLAIISDKPINEITNLVDSIRGFIIVQKGECKKFIDVYCINLICSQHSKGALLIGLYLYCINNNTQISVKKGLLELGNSFYNMGGLCLYSKFGFEYDSTLYSQGQDRCFDDHNNLPMIVDLIDKYKTPDNCNQMIRDILLGTNKGFPKPMICDMRGSKQQMLGLAMNVNTFLQENVPEYITDYTLSDYTVLHYDTFYNKIMNADPNELLKFINDIQSIPEDVILQYKNEFIELPAPEPTPEPPVQRVTRNKALQQSIPDPTPQVSVKRRRLGGNKKRRSRRRYKK